MSAPVVTSDEAVDPLLAPLLAGDRRALAQAITLIESTRSDHRVRADALLAPVGLVEVFRHADGQNARSFPARWPLLKLDHIYVRGMASDRPLFMPRHPWSQLSDHAPLAAELQLRDVS